MKVQIKDNNFVAIVNKTDSSKTQNIKKIWKANTDSKKIERITNLDAFNCFNEYFTEK